MKVKLTDNEHIHSFTNPAAEIVNNAYLYDLVLDSFFCILGPAVIYWISLQEQSQNIITYAIVFIFWFIYVISTYRDLRRHQKDLLIEFNNSHLRFGSKNIKFSKLLFPSDNRTFWLKVFDYKDDKEVLNVKLTKSAYKEILAYYYSSSQ